ncbi:MAG: alkylhydroperoxidase [Gammaproteobacteria bacterium]|nr:alkylhydroperoxidase [Gammaproteobacteria bacterium]OUV74521.1 MAG: alkylhydroperoxidase [Gammaproteobacteria bacterium TMED139]|tara:strand:+ start:253 stop:834 length:582 start_codon:yes stop_codon:yes gene_type:complete
MKNDRVSLFPLPDINTLPDDLKKKILEVQDKSGFIPNVFLALAHRPEEFRAFFSYHDALMNKESGISKGEREMIVVATSALNECLYCVVAHGAILRIREKNSLIADQLATNYKKADITDRQRAMLDFAVKVSRHANTISDEDIQALAQHGFSDQDVWDIGSIAAFFALSNRLANMANIRPNEEFYHMGRIEIG